MFKHGFYTKEALKERQPLRGLFRQSRKAPSGRPALRLRVVAQALWSEHSLRLSASWPGRASPRSESFEKVALREHHPRHDPHQHDHDGRNPRDNRPSPPAFFQLAQLALQIHPPSGERVR
jgi:hypothetical protein